ncbi:carboxylesterase family protein [Rhodococcus sp. BH2-1]|nr:carboxylesterase family protein [Rhodococcus sp. BH2-1]
MSFDHRVIAQPPTGPLIGSQGSDGIFRFPGVRYGVAERFQPPAPLPPHSDPVDVTEPGPICPQLSSRLEAAMGEQWGEPRQSEDCLYMAIATPNLSGDRPVMVWLHGGGFLTGGGTLPWYDGGRLATDGDVVVVSVNYRVGALGYLVHQGVSAGNLGLYDQLLALQWVRQNISAFGGDPTKITIFGQSAGALSSIALLSMPQSRNLVNNAIVQSCPSLDLFQKRDSALEIGAYFASAVTGDLKNVPTGELLSAQAKTLAWHAAKDRRSTIPPFGLVCDTPLGSPQMNEELLLTQPAPPLMIGYTSDECSAFAAGVEDPELRQALADLSDPLIIRPTKDIARKYSNAGADVYQFEFVWHPEAGGFGATHCIELPFLLGTRESWQSSPMLGAANWEEIERLGRPLRKLWSDFARDGEARSIEPGLHQESDLIQIDCLKAPATGSDR